MRMPRREIIRVFEFDEIKEDCAYNGITFKPYQLQAIQQFNSKNNHKYFTLTHKGVKFNNYVGVIQIGNLTVEILPKADRQLNTQIINIIKNHHKNDREVAKVITLVKAGGGIEYAKKTMNRYHNDAVKILSQFENNDAKKSLILLLDFVVNRKK